MTKPPRNVTLADAAYQAVRAAITGGKLQPGERLSEYKVAAWQDISRTPAREALRRLEADGLLLSHPKRGLVVAEFDESAVHELYATRELLEGTVAGLAARFATDAEISGLQHMLEREAAFADLPAKMFEHNLAFHRLVAQAGRNRYLAKFLLTLSDTLSAHRRVSTLVDPKRRKQVLREHRDLVEAIARRDEAGARAAAARHIQGALQARLAVQRKAGPG